MEQAQPDTRFRVAEPTVASLSYPATAQVPIGTFIYGQFDVPESDFFFYTPASLNVTVRRIQPSGTAFYGPQNFNFPFPVRQLMTLPDAVRDRVLIIPYFGNPAVYDYEGGTGFTLVEGCIALPYPAPPILAPSTVPPCDCVKSSLFFEDFDFLFG